MIAILMGTYNGEKYITEQIDSLLAQTMQDFVVYIHDDCSTDNTYRILETYQRKYSKKFIISQNERNTSNPKNNFMQMMIKYKADYVMLCDQDDVWLKDKVERTFLKMQELENQYGSQMPLLVHTDLEVVDQNLNTIASSFRHIISADYNRTELKDALIVNIVTGCTAMYNQSLSQFIISTPDFFMMHDWWLMMVACAFGKIGQLDESTILYRQHGENSIGATNLRTLRYIINKLLHKKEIRELMEQTYRQTESFLNLYQNQLNDSQRLLLETYSYIPSLCKWKRWRTICRLGVLKNGIIRKIANFIFV